MTWLRAHWLAVVLGLAVGGAGAWLLKPDPQPAVELHTASGYVGAETQTVQVVEKQGPVRIVTHTITKPGPGCTGPEVDETTTEDRGDASRETGSKDELHVAGMERADLTVTPPHLPRWALGAGVEDPLGARRPTLTAGMRLLGPVWLRAGVTPARGLGGVTVGAEVQW